MIPVAELWAVIWKGVATAVTGPTELARLGVIATLSVVDTLLTLIDATVLTDIRLVKESLIRRVEAKTGEIEAKTQAAQAEAKKKVAEATDAANKATLHSRKDAIAQAQKDQARAAAAKSAAEVEAIRQEIETKRMQAIVDARIKFLEALTRLRAEGGDVMFDAKNLESIRRLLSPPAELTDPPQPPE